MALTLAHFRTLDNIKVVPLAYLIGDVHEFLERTILLSGVAVLMSFKSPAVDAVGIIKNHMKVRMLLVNMASHEILILAFKELLAYLLTELQGSLWSDLTGLETHDEVLGENGTSACSVRPYFFIITVSLFGISTAPLCEDQSAVIRLFGIGDIFQ